MFSETKMSVQTSEAGSAGLVKTQYYTFADHPNEMVLDSGERLGPITLAYECYGRLNDERDNAVLVFHALSGDAHAAGISADLTGISAGAFPPIVVTTRMASQQQIAALEPHAHLMVAGEEQVDPHLMMRMLFDEHRIRRLVVEGGPTLNGVLLGQGLVDELFWTLAPKLVGGPALHTMIEGNALPIDNLARLELLSLHHHENELFLRYRVLS